ncbi:MAG: hypothetical protein HKN47_18290 [Pirellulaceae bacterium]|nr:hypothetical protein [Pirellulaceae bacterium]
MFRRGSRAPWLAVVADLAWLLAIHAVVLSVMAVAGGLDQGDLRLFGVFTLFLLPGWLLSARWMPIGGALATRYALTSILAFVIHVWLAWPASRLGLGFDAYYIAFAFVALAAMVARGVQLRRSGSPVNRLPLHRLSHYRLHCGQVILSIAMLLLIAAAWRVPHSNDIEQFLLQQIDMAQERSFSPSAIGMTTWGIDDPMPRWDANAYHVWFSLMGDVTRLPVEGIVKRWATIPIAVISLLMFSLCVQRYAGRRVSMWLVALAIIGPVTLWFRSYNAYVYAMRLANNLCLDKDFALFWLIPAWLWIFHRCLRLGEIKVWALLVLMTPLCITIHPMTSIYLCLLIPMAVISSAQLNRSGLLRSLFGGGLALAMFLFVFTSGGAQAYHHEIETIIHHDATVSSQTGRRLHHWDGHYATVPDAGVELDTTQWNQGTLRLRPRMLWTCSALVMLPLAGALWVGVLLIRRRSIGIGPWRSWMAVMVSLIMLWLLFAGSSLFLTQRPHLYRGFERLHWFAFLPSIVAIAGCLSAIWMGIRRSGVLPRTARRALGSVAAALLVFHLASQAWHVSQGQHTLLFQVPVLHSLFDIYAVDEPEKTRRVLSRFSIDAGPVPDVPAYLRQSDRVLILHYFDRITYWELRQAVWWPELYGEGNALALFGEPFLQQWQAYYDAVDWSDEPGVDQWIQRQGVTIIMDDRVGAQEYVEKLGQRIGHVVTPVSKGIWRLKKE